MGYQADGLSDGVLHHQRFLVVVHDLHFKWPELPIIDPLTSHVIIDFLNFQASWGLLKNRH